MKKKTNTDGIQGDFQQIHSLDEACQSSNTYMGISISFLKALWGEEWRQVFDSAYGDDIVGFYRDYRFEMDEWDSYIL